MIDGVRSRGVAENADLFVGLAGLEHGRAGAVGVDHAVTVVGIRDAGQGLAADHQRARRVTRPQKVIGLDHALDPAGTPEGQVVGDALRVLDLQVLFDPCGQAGAEVATAVVGQDVTEVVGEDDVVETLAIDAGVLDRLFRGQIAEIRGDLVVLGKTPLADLGDLLELADGLLVVSRVDRLVVVHEKPVVQELVVAHPLVRDVAAGSGDHCPPHRTSSRLSTARTAEGLF